jgi:hypothetical protein
MITYQLPRRIRFIPASAIFTANFNVPAVGKYDFNSQVQVFVDKILANTVYMIDAFSVAGNVSSEDFLSAVDIVPKIAFQKTLNNEQIFDGPIQIHTFSTDRQIVHFFKTGANNTGINATLTGRLNQRPAFVGLASISLSINLSLHAIDESEFEKMYKREA